MLSTMMDFPLTVGHIFEHGHLVGEVDRLGKIGESVDPLELPGAVAFDDPPLGKL